MKVAFSPTATATAKPLNKPSKDYLQDRRFILTLRLIDLLGNLILCGKPCNMSNDRGSIFQSARIMEEHLYSFHLLELKNLIIISNIKDEI